MRMRFFLHVKDLKDEREMGKKAIHAIFAPTVYLEQFRMH